VFLAVGMGLMAISADEQLEIIRDVNAVEEWLKEESAGKGDSRRGAEAQRVKRKRTEDGLPRRPDKE